MASYLGSLVPFSDRPTLQSLHSQFSTENFTLKHVIGEGKFGKVWFAEERKVGYSVAIKTFDKAIIEEMEAGETVMRELLVHSQLKHPNIIQFYTYFHDSKQVYLVEEFAEYGSLFSIVQDLKNKRLDELTTAKYTRQIAEALLYLHEKMYYHGDLKPENILVTSEKVVKLADFGLSWRCSAFWQDSTVFGTIEYIPPELLNNNPYDYSIDNWSLGVLIYELLSGKSPFYHANDEVIKKRISQVKYTIPRFIKGEARKIIKQLLVAEPLMRLTMSEVINHKWIENCLGS